MRTIHTGIGELIHPDDFERQRWLDAGLLNPHEVARQTMLERGLLPPADVSSNATDTDATIRKAPTREQAEALRDAAGELVDAARTGPAKDGVERPAHGDRKFGLHNRGSGR